MSMLLILDRCLVFRMRGLMFVRMNVKELNKKVLVIMILKSIKLLKNNRILLLFHSNIRI